LNGISSPPSSYIDDVGFPLISLFNGFTIVALIDLKMPAWLVVGGAMLAAIVGAQRVSRQKAKTYNTQTVQEKTNIKRRNTPSRRE